MINSLTCWQSMITTILYRWDSCLPQDGYPEIPKLVKLWSTAWSGDHPNKNTTKIWVLAPDTISFLSFLWSSFSDHSQLLDHIASKELCVWSRWCHVTSYGQRLCFPFWMKGVNQVSLYRWTRSDLANSCNSRSFEYSPAQLPNRYYTSTQHPHTAIMGITAEDYVKLSRPEQLRILIQQWYDYERHGIEISQGLLDACKEELAKLVGQTWLVSYVLLQSGWPCPTENSLQEKQEQVYSITYIWLKRELSFTDRGLLPICVSTLNRMTTVMEAPTVIQPATLQATLLAVLATSTCSAVIYRWRSSRKMLAGDVVVLPSCLCALIAGRREWYEMWFQWALSTFNKDPRKTNLVVPGNSDSRVMMKINP